jgi:adenosylhomocysteine nucleosidase
MRIGIIAAMEEELDEFRKNLVSAEETVYERFMFYTGSLFRHEIMLSLCGIGKVNAAVGTTLLIDRFRPDFVINSGVAGGINPQTLTVGDIVVASEIRHHDADATVFNYEYGQIPKMPPAYYPDKRIESLALEAAVRLKDIHVFEGMIISGDSFIHDNKQIQSIRDNFPKVLAVEMESAAIAQTCYLFSTPFLIIRSISDIVTENESEKTYKASMPEMAKRSVLLVMKLLELMSKGVPGK